MRNEIVHGALMHARLHRSARHSQVEETDDAVLTTREDATRYKPAVALHVRRPATTSCAAARLGIRRCREGRGVSSMRTEVSRVARPHLLGATQLLSAWGRHKRVNLTPSGKHVCCVQNTLRGLYCRACVAW